MHALWCFSFAWSNQKLSKHTIPSARIRNSPVPPMRYCHEAGGPPLHLACVNNSLEKRKVRSSRAGVNRMMHGEGWAGGLAGRMHRRQEVLA